MADKAKFAYGSLAGLDAALQNGAVDAFDLLCLYDDGVARIGWVDKNGNPVLVDVPEDKVVVVDTLPETGVTGSIYVFNEEAYIWNGTKFTNLCKPTDVTELQEQITALEEKDAEFAAKDAELEAEVAEKIGAEDVSAMYASKKFEITSVPTGTLIDYRDDEIRVMCPVDAQWVTQSVGATGNANMYYMGFKAYAPEGAVSFKEGDRGVIIDKMFTFDDDFAGTDKYGRNYSICWLALASFDAASNTWSYFGKNSTPEKYIGWDYVVEWYDADGVIISYDHIRINLSNEECHFVVEPYYLASVEKEAKAYTDARIEEISGIPVVEF